MSSSPGRGRRAARVPAGERAAYGVDLAYVHHTGYGDFSRDAAPGLLRMLRTNRIRRGRVVDLGCGSGIWAAALSRAGYRVLGVDISPAMIRHCRAAVPGGSFRTGSLLETALPRCAAVTSLGECLNYTFDAGNTMKGIYRLFRRVHDALEPGGLFVFDVLVHPGPRANGTVSHHRLGRDWALLVDLETADRGRRLTRRITTFRKTEAGIRRSEEIHRLRIFSRRELPVLLRRAGFEAGTLDRYGRRPFRDGVCGYLARKPGSRRGRSRP